MMITPLLLALSAPAVPQLPAAPCTAALAADRVAGRWLGPFAGADWTFELTREAKGWTGRYQTTRSESWHTLEDVSVDHGCATFSLKSQPRLTFFLTLDSDGATLAGAVQIVGRATLSFAAKRVS